jgi:hypothetical protein
MVADGPWRTIARLEINPFSASDAQRLLEQGSFTVIQRIRKSYRPPTTPQKLSAPTPRLRSVAVAATWGRNRDMNDVFTLLHVKFASDTRARVAVFADVERS